MDERLEIIFSRRSIRRYTGEPVSQSDIDSLLQAAMAAPSAGDRKPWHFVVVTDRQKLRELAGLHAYSKMIDQAALCIAVCGDPAVSNWWIQDCAAAMENLLVAVVGLGLGAVWIGCHVDPEHEHAVRDMLSIPQQIGVMSLVAIGHPAEEKEARTQYDPARIHQAQW
jgi:nitroreductase